MVSPVNYCSSCGHLSPPDWEECHHCGDDFEGETVWSESRLTDYYERIEAGYGRYLVLGYLSTFVVPVLTFVLATVVYRLAPGIQLLWGGTLLLGVAGAIGGLSLALGSWAILDGEDLLLGGEPTLPRTILSGLLLLVVLTVILLIISIIPAVNALVGVALVFYALATPWFVYKTYKRTKVDRATAVDSLLADDVRDQDVRNTALAVLAATPEGDVTPADRDVLQDHLDSRLRLAVPLVRAETFLEAATVTHRDAPEAAKRELVERVIEIGETLRSEREYEDAVAVFDAADGLRQGIDLDDYPEEIEDNRRQIATAVIADRVGSLDRLQKRTLQAGEALADDGEFEQSMACYRSAELLAAALDRDDEVDEITQRRSRLETEMTVSRFEESVDELFDLLRSAERAVDAGQYETAIQRFRTIDDRLAPSAPDEHEESHRELTDRLDSGLATAARQRLLGLLPESPTPFERELLAELLPAPIGDRLDSIYDGTLDEGRYPELLDEDWLGTAERATELVERYRRVRDRIEAATAPSEPYLDRLDEIVRSAEQSPDDAVRSGELFAAVLERLDRLAADDPDQSIVEWADAVRTALRHRESLREGSELKRVRTLVDSMDTVEEYQSAFPSLSIDAIVDEMRERIEDGVPLAPEAFSAEFDRIDRLVEQEIETLTGELAAFVEEWRRHPAVDAREWRRAIEEARESGDPDPVLEPYRRMQQMQGSMWSRDELYQFSWEAFEHLVANLYEQKGYETTVTAGSRDLGVDVWAENGVERIAIQVKQFAEGNTVGREVIQKLESTIARGDADRVVIVTSSSFATTAERYAANSSAVELIDGDELVADLTRYNVPSSGLE
ncbi:restriction endonuclease [Halolamina salina]|uniref:restriction endonuclease n=1 Tax=Halolamina salina TaxID=1220023 RepID=UPI003621FB3D